MPDGKTMAILALCAMGYVGAVKVAHLKPVEKFNHGVKKTALVVSQPARHPVKDLKAIGHFIKGDR